ncbi:transporter [Bacillus sp. DX1.1]|nr:MULTISPECIES: transporter [unclassified Bacillus (in: firmicutes)]MDM5156825.1 transporter [Bacillus sp. DX1.1]WJE81072.1 transporter [Bacillus sp. DX3.1]
MSLEALIIFSLLNAGQLAGNTQGEVQQNPKDEYVYIEKQDDSK